MRSIINIAGTKFRPAETKNYIRDLTIGEALVAEREPDNKHDPNAIRLIHAGTFIGYVPASTAEEVAPLIDDGATVECEIVGFANDITPVCELIVEL